MTADREADAVGRSDEDACNVAAAVVALRLFAAFDEVTLITDDDEAELAREEDDRVVELMGYVIGWIPVAEAVPPDFADEVMTEEEAAEDDEGWLDDADETLDGDPALDDDPTEEDATDVDDE